MPRRHDHAAWSEAELNRLRELAATGMGSGGAAKILNDEFHDGIAVRTYAGINIARTRHGIYVTRATASTVPTVPRSGTPDIGVDPLEWLERIRPVAVTPPSLPRASVTADTDITVVAGDFHFPCEDQAAVAIFLETCRQLKPGRVVLNGDLPDLLAVSRYPKDSRKRHTWPLRDEATAMHGFLQALESVVPRTTVILETEANHSGNGTASRWWRYISEGAGHLTSMPGAEERLSYQAWWYPAWSRLELVESVVIANDLLVLHGDVVRKNAAYSARGMADKWRSSVMHNHTHRQGMGVLRVPGLPHRGEAVQRYYETGCMCRLDPSYASAPDWTRGFSIVRESGEHYGAEMVTITNGAAVVATLGQTVRA